MSAVLPRARGFVAACFLVTGCGGAEIAPAPAPGPDVARYFPLEAGVVYSYRVADGGRLPALATLRVLEVTEGEGGRARARIQRNRLEPEVLLRDDTGFRYEGEAGYLLRAPLTVGATFPGRAGRTAIVARVDESVRLADGEHLGCVRVDERDPASGVEASTTYCPDVGPVRVVSSVASELSSQRIEVRAELIARVRVEP